MQIPFARIEKFVIPEKEAEGGPMKCLWLDVNGQRLLATNGHMAVRETIAVHEEDVSGLIPVEAFELARKELKAIAKVMKEDLPDPWLNVICREDAIFIQNLLTNTTHLVVRPKLEEGKKFPSVDLVFPTLTAGPSVSLNGEYLSTLIAALGCESLSLSFWVESAEKCVTIASAQGSAVAVLMPMRGDTDHNEVNQRGVSKEASAEVTA